MIGAAGSPLRRGTMVDHEAYSLDQFQRDASVHIERLRETGCPAVLTVDGTPQAVVLSPGAYEELLDRLDRAEAIAGIQRGLESMRRGEGTPARAALEQLRSQLGVGAAVQ